MVACGEGQDSKVVASRLRVTPQMVGKWRARYGSLPSNSVCTARFWASGENFGDFLMLAQFSIEGASSKSGAVQVNALAQRGNGGLGFDEAPVHLNCGDSLPSALCRIRVQARRTVT
jgi:hypothetical protein